MQHWRKFAAAVTVAALSTIAWGGAAYAGDQDPGDGQDVPQAVEQYEPQSDDGDQADKDKDTAKQEEPQAKEEEPQTEEPQAEDKEPAADDGEQADKDKDTAKEEESTSKKKEETKTEEPASEETKTAEPAQTRSQNGQCPSGYTKLMESYNSKVWTADADYSSVILVAGFGTDLEQRNYYAGAAEQGDELSRPDGKTISHVCGMPVDEEPEPEYVTPQRVMQTPVCGDGPNDAFSVQGITLTAEWKTIAHVMYKVRWVSEIHRWKVEFKPADGYMFKPGTDTYKLFRENWDKCEITPTTPTQVPVCGPAPNDDFMVGDTMLEKNQWTYVGHVKYYVEFTKYDHEMQWVVTAKPASDAYGFPGRDVRVWPFPEDTTRCVIQPGELVGEEVCGIPPNDDVELIKVRGVRYIWLDEDGPLYQVKAIAPLGYEFPNGETWMILTYEENTDPCIVDPGELWGEDVCGLPGNDVVRLEGASAYVDYERLGWYGNIYGVRATAHEGYSFGYSEYTESWITQTVLLYFDEGTPCLIEPGELMGEDVCGVPPNDTFRLTGGSEYADYERLGWDGNTYGVRATADAGYAFGYDDVEEEWITEVILTYTDEGTPCPAAEPEVLYLPKCNPDGVFANDIFVMMVEDEPVAIADGDVVDGVMYTVTFDEPTGMWTLTGTATDGYALEEGTWEWTGTEYTFPCLGTTPLTTPTLTIETSCEAGFSLDAEYADVPEDTVTFDVYIGDLHFTLDDDTGMESYMWSVSEGLPTTGYDWTVDGTYQGQTETLATGTQDTCVEPEGGELAGGETKTTEPVTTTTKVLSATAATAVTATPTYTG